MKVPLLSVVSYLVFASLVNAVFSSQASLPTCKASVNTSLAPAALNNASLVRTSVIPISSKTAIAEVPLSSHLLNPTKKLDIAPAASSLNACLNSSELIPATLAKSEAEKRALALQIKNAESDMNKQENEWSNEDKKADLKAEIEAIKEKADLEKEALKAQIDSIKEEADFLFAAHIDFLML